MRQLSAACAIRAYALSQVQACCFCWIDGRQGGTESGRCVLHGLPTSIGYRRESLCANDSAWVLVHWQPSKGVLCCVALRNTVHRATYMHATSATTITAAAREVKLQVQGGQSRLGLEVIPHTFLYFLFLSSFYRLRRALRTGQSLHHAAKEVAPTQCYPYEREP